LKLEVFREFYDYVIQHKNFVIPTHLRGINQYVRINADYTA